MCISTRKHLIIRLCNTSPRRSLLSTQNHILPLRNQKLKDQEMLPSRTTRTIILRKLHASSFQIMAKISVDASVLLFSQHPCNPTCTIAYSHLFYLCHCYYCPLLNAGKSELFLVIIPIYKSSFSNI